MFFLSFVIYGLDVNEELDSVLLDYAYPLVLSLPLLPSLSFLVSYPPLTFSHLKYSFIK